MYPEAGAVLFFVCIIAGIASGCSLIVLALHGFWKGD